MPKKRKSNPTIQCEFFAWKLRVRSGVYYADGRSGGVPLGRHSLGTKDRDEALCILRKLDRRMAEQRGLVEPESRPSRGTELTVDRGRELYEEHIRRPQVAGGTSKATQKRYKAVFDKFVPFVQAKGSTTWAAITSGLLTKYATQLEKDARAPKTIKNEIVTILQADKWLCQEGHVSREPLRYPLGRVESEKAYCYSREEVEAILAHCGTTDGLRWMYEVVYTLAHTGVRIGELVQLRWSDLELTDESYLTVADESGHGGGKANRRLTKSRRSRRIPIEQDLVQVLNGIRRIDEWVFHGPRGGRLKQKTACQVLVREVLEPLAHRFPARHPDAKSFVDGRLHSFRHFFCSECANGGIAERVAMEWMGHADSAMVRHYYHLKDDESRRQIKKFKPLGGAGGSSAGGEEQNQGECDRSDDE